MNLLLWNDGNLHFPNVREYFKVIDNRTDIAIIDPEIVRELRNVDRRKKVSADRIYRNGIMVPVFPDLDENGNLTTNLYEWTGLYDPDGLGIMAEPLYR